MRVYIAGPLTTNAPTEADKKRNIRRAIDTAEQLVHLGHTPYIPHLCYLWEMCYPHDYNFWLSYDISWLKMCDALYRMEGASNGADFEVQQARSFGIPVSYSLDWFRR